MRIFPQQSLLINEFDKIKLLVEEACAGNGGMERAKKMMPAHNFDEMLLWLNQTDEFRRIISNGEPLRMEQYPDVAVDMKLLGIRNSVLQAPQFLQLLKICRLMKTIHLFFKEHAAKYPSLSILIKDVVFEDVIAISISAVIEDNGELRTSASPGLASIRKQIGRKRMEADQIYQSVMMRYRKNGWLTDSEESWRNGRRVISIFNEHKRSAKGVIHDISSTGKTCFIEPDEAFGINNLLVELMEDEKQEIYRILKELTDNTRKYHSPLSTYVNLISTFDFIAAKAHVGILMDAWLPFVINKPLIDLKDARHPLLYIYHKKAGKQVIPFNLKLEDEQRILVISGPNAGGKTVCMKTAGLLQIMLQSGMLVTADGNSRFGFFKNVLVDIGDSQSLEFELSTYSSRLKHMKTFLQKADEHTLFLIDEFGTGTDPSLGGALAEAILEELNLLKSIGIITTHYMNLKVLADRTPGIINGSMAFDSKKLEPQYRLDIGKPGSSYTFVVAERSGIPYHVIKKAKKRVKNNTLQLEQTLNKLEHEKAELRKILDDAEKNQKDLKQLTSKYRSNIETQDKRSSELEEKMRQKELRVATQLEDKFQRFVKDWKNAKNKKEVLLKYEQQFGGRKKELSEKDARKQEELLKRNQQHIKKGSKVRLKNGRVTGVVEQIKEDKVHVLFGNVKSITEMTNLVFVEEERD
ncbi:MAG: endonuclease MutS2 [Bacteroidota bacterium]